MTDHNLDQAALEAAAKELSDAFVPWGYDWTTEAIAAITAYQQAMAPQVREAFQTYKDSYDDFGLGVQHYHTLGRDEVDRRKWACAAAEAEFLRLVGAETEAER